MIDSIINKDILSIFKKNNIEPIKSINEKLDPNLHQAMLEIEDNTKESGTIVQEIQKGYIMKDRLFNDDIQDGGKVGGGLYKVGINEVGY